MSLSPSDRPSALHVSLPVILQKLIDAMSNGEGNVFTARVETSQELRQAHPSSLPTSHSPPSLHPTPLLSPP
jgi:hypothetical protein